MNCINSSLVPLKREGLGPSVYFVHPAGGHVICYRNLAKFIMRPLYAFQSPFLQGSGEIPENITEIANIYVEQLQRHQERGPYYLGAWSTGCYIAFEMARQLLASGEEITKLFILDSPSPHDNSMVHEYQTLTWFLEDRSPSFTCSAMNGLDLSTNDISNLKLSIKQLPQDEQEYLDAEALLRNYQVFRAMIKAGRTYFAELIDVEMVLCRTNEQVVEEFDKHPYREMKYWGWELLTSKPISKKIVRGNHYTFLQDSYVWETAMYINRHTQISHEQRWSLV